MRLCTACNEFTVSEYFDRYDDEIYRKCRLCGKIQEETQSERAIKPVKRKKICIGKK